MTGSFDERRLGFTGTGEAGSVACGALIRLQVSVQAGCVHDADYQAYGCPATIACAKGLTDRVRGSGLLDAAALSEQDLLRATPEAEGRDDCARLAIDALHFALTDAIGSLLTLPPVEGIPESEGVVVGMSGGVDSGVTALLLREQGKRVVGVTLRLWDTPDVSGERSCCSPETVARARRVAHSMGIPHLTLDLTETFRQSVVQYFIDSYEAGITPNPCAKCNARVRFGAMLRLAEYLGCTRVATGHYARMDGVPPRLKRGVDMSKDQSYVLAEVDPQMLARVVFPLGGRTKSEVRALAAERGLEGHAAPESQEICFIPDDDHRHFLRERLGEVAGDVVDAQGNRLARHTGVYNYTIGQRRGLGLAHPEPRFVIRLDARSRSVVVGARAELATRSLIMEDLTWHASLPTGPLTVQVRSTGESLRTFVMEEAGVRLWPSDSGDVGGTPPARLQLRFDPPAEAVAPGQTAVVYEGESVVVAGTIVDTCT